MLLKTIFLQVIMKTQFRDPDGILNHLQHVTPTEYEHIFYILLGAAEAFDLCMIKRNNTLQAHQKILLIEKAKSPLTLLNQVRFYMRKHFGTSLSDVACKLDVPITLHHYLLFDYS